MGIKNLRQFHGEYWEVKYTFVWAFCLNLLLRDMALFFRFGKCTFWTSNLNSLGMRSWPKAIKCRDWPFYWNKYIYVIHGEIMFTKAFSKPFYISGCQTLRPYAVNHVEAPWLHSIICWLLPPPSPAHIPLPRSCISIKKVWIIFPQTKCVVAWSWDGGKWVELVALKLCHACIQLERTERKVTNERTITNH